jgi:hypothetical protein
MAKDRAGELLRVDNPMTAYVTQGEYAAPCPDLELLDVEGNVNGNAIHVQVSQN